MSVTYTKTFYPQNFCRVKPHISHAEVNAETCLPVFTTGYFAQRHMFFYVDRVSMTSTFLKFSIWLLSFWRIDFYSFINSLIGPTVILSIVITSPVTTWLLVHIRHCMKPSVLAHVLKAVVYWFYGSVLDLERSKTSHALDLEHWK